MSLMALIKETTSAVRVIVGASVGAVVVSDDPLEEQPPEPRTPPITATATTNIIDNTTHKNLLTPPLFSTDHQGLPAIEKPAERRDTGIVRQFVQWLRRFIGSATHQSRRRCHLLRRRRRRLMFNVPEKAAVLAISRTVGTPNT